MFLNRKCIFVLNIPKNLLKTNQQQFRNINGFSNSDSPKLVIKSKPQTPSLREELYSYRTKIYDNERKRQLSNMVPRIEKIEVKYKGKGISDSATMYMNKCLSTPYHCAMHISSVFAQSSVLAVVTPLETNANVAGNQVQTTSNSALTPVIENQKPDPIVWGLHNPLTYDCELEILKFSMGDAPKWQYDEVNEAYWRSCSLVLGAVMQEAFKEKYNVGLHKLPQISPTSGAFCYDVVLDECLSEWKPTESDLIFLTKLARSMVSKGLKFENLKVDKELANEIFIGDQSHLDRIASASSDQITLCRFGNYIDICHKPLISDTSKIFHYVVTALHQLCVPEKTNYWRVQGLSLPSDLKVHHLVWARLEQRARRFVNADVHYGALETDIKPDSFYKSIENKTKQYMISTGQWADDRWLSTTGSFDPERNEKS